MVSVLMDRNTGDILLDEKNNIVEVDNKNGFEQILIGLFHCDVGSEILNQAYGFDLKRALRESYRPSPEMFIESLVLEALDPEKEKMISKVEYVKAEKEDNKMNVFARISSIFNDSITLEEEIEL